jgi:pimeloyl-ACP methyl ester carboxylesterase
MCHRMVLTLVVILVFSTTLLPAGRQEVTQPSSQEVSFSHGPDRLQGTLYRPDQKGPVPAVVVLGGSDRSARGKVKTQLAEHFARHGVAALTYDSPGTGGSTGNAMLQTCEDRSSEAIAALKFLQAKAGIDPQKVGLVGGSQGALIALMAATQDPEVAFAIAVSGNTGIPHLEVVRYRIDMMGFEQGLSLDEIQKAQVFAEILFALLAGLDVVEWHLIQKKTERWPDDPWKELIALTRTCRSGAPDAETWDSLRKIVAGWRSEPWFNVAVTDRRQLDRFLAMSVRQFLAYLEIGPYASGDFWNGPRETRIANPGCPVLAIWGDRDEFLPPHRCAASLRERLSRTEGLDLTIKMVPNATHSLTRTTRNLEFVEGYPDMITEWLKQKLAGR